MRGFYQILMPLLSLFLVRVDLTDLFPLKIDVEIVKIYDGDTVQIRHGSYKMALRLARIDSPELKQDFLNGKKGAGILSKECLERLIKKEKKFILKFESYDIYKRMLGDLNSVSLSMVKNGCTTLYPNAQFSSVAEKFLYLETLKKAKATRSGLWQFGGIIRPKIFRSISKRNGYLQYRQQAHFRRPYRPERK